MKAKEIAEWFLLQDKDGKIFNKNLINRNGRFFYEGNARLNKYLHLAQNIYIAKTGNALFEDCLCLYAYDNGGVVPQVQENFSILSLKKKTPELPEEVICFLKKIDYIFRNATIDELIELSHEDTAWQEKCHNYSHETQKMDSLEHADEYAEQYQDILSIAKNL